METLNSYSTDHCIDFLTKLLADKDEQVHLVIKTMCGNSHTIYKRDAPELLVMLNSLRTKHPKSAVVFEYVKDQSTESSHAIRVNYIIYE